MNRSSMSFNAFELKVAAIAAMLLDHIGAVFFPGLLTFRIVGRISAPIMAFFIAEGFFKTRNVKRYMLRLFVFAVFSMLPYSLVFRRSPFNILFDLLLGLLAVYYSERLKKEYQKWGLVVLAAIIALLLQSDGMMGISTLVFLFFRFRNDKKAMIYAMMILYLGIMAFSFIFYMVNDKTVMFSNPVFWIKPISMVSLPLIFKYNGERGTNLKYIFYAFYPGHLLVVYILMIMLK